MLTGRGLEIRLPVTDMLTEMDADMHQYVNSGCGSFSQNVEFRST